MTFDVSATLAAAEAELQALTAARAELDRRITGLRLAIQGLRQMQDGSGSGDSESAEGLTASCRAALRAAGRPVSARELKEQLDERGFDWSRYASPISAVYTVLKRLVAQGQAVAAESDGGVRYCWKAVRVVVATKEDLADPTRIEELMRQAREREGNDD